MEEHQELDWRSDRLFTGSTVGYPVELFIQLIEQEANQLCHDEAKLCNNAWHLISSDNSSPTGVWKDCMKTKWKDLSWAEFKAELLIAFGHKGAYSLEQMFGLVQSLTKGETELYSTFLLRAEWVLNTISDYLKDKTMAHILFLLGISEMDQLFILEKIKNCAKKSDDMTAIVALLDNYEDFSHQVKQEPLDIEDGVDGFEGSIKEEVPTDADRKSGKRKAFAMGDDFDGDYLPDGHIDQEDKPLRAVTHKKGKNRKIGGLDESGKDAKPKKKSKKKLSDGRFRCDKCHDELFSTHALLTKHIQKTHPVKCVLCPEQFLWVNEDDWEVHGRQHFQESDGQCPLCPLKVDDFTTLQAHQTSVHGGKQTRCTSCQAPVQFREFNHKCREFIGKNPICTERSVRAGELRRLRANLRIYHLAKGEDPKKVKSMSMTFMSFHDNVTIFYCGFCFQDFPKELQLSAHQRDYHNGFKFQCELCFEFKGKTLNATAQHKLMKHNVVLETYEKYECLVDGCIFMHVEKSHLDNHNKLCHSDEHADSTTCKICGKRFGRHPDALRRHVEAVHMNLKKFPCTLCPAGYANKTGLDAHMAEFHEGKGKIKFCCPLCGEEYRHNHSLHQHIANKHPVDGVQYLPAHMSNQRFECKDCGRVYTEKQAFKDHVRKMHMEDKWVKCHLCEHRGKTNAHFRSHFLAKHLKITLKGSTCKVCGNSYTRDKDCWIHIALKHEQWSKEKSDKDWKQLSLTKPDLVKRRDVKKDEWEALKGHVDDKYLPVI